jgi:hypothetical protein
MWSEFPMVIWQSFCDAREKAIKESFFDARHAGINPITNGENAPG